MQGQSARRKKSEATLSGFYHEAQSSNLIDLCRGVHMVTAIFGLICVVVGALLTLAREWWFHRHKTQKEREYLAVVASCALDAYARQCAAVAADDGLYHGQTDQDGYHRIQTDTPKFEPEKLAVEWKSLPARLMYQILDFPNQADLAESKVEGAFDYSATPPDFAEGFEERMFEYAKLGKH